MKQLSKLKNVMGILTLGVVVAVTATASVSAAPASSVPPRGQTNTGQQSQPPVEPGTKDAPKTEKLGPTKEIAVAKDGKALALPSTGLAGNVAGVDFQTFYNYCYKNLVYTTVNNTTSATKYIRVQLYNGSVSYDYYTSVAAGGSYVYPAFYGVDGTYSAYLYVWNGSSYAYDEYKGGTNTCNVSVTRTYNTGGWVQLKIQNLGTAYATQVSSELAPYPNSGTYTGTHYDYPAAGGAAIYRWFQVGTQPYGIASYTSGAYTTPSFFTGDL